VRRTNLESAKQKWRDKESRTGKGMDTKSSKTHESSASNISITGALAEEVSPSASFGEEVLEKSNSSRRFLSLSRIGSSEKAGGGDKVGPLSSREILA
jgi:hypothetical protein